MGTTKVTADATKLRQLKELMGSVSDRTTADLPPDIALGIESRRRLVARITAHRFTPELHEATKHGIECAE
ncbi:hypothetical protein [Microbacterium sp. KR10-403]|uniref:hypothetical protein n=1 Tax=Microbacterium sp. KR10-403 TaxID=3158581 RepID=UPI0032E51EEB